MRHLYLILLLSSLLLGLVVGCGQTSPELGEGTPELKTGEPVTEEPVEEKDVDSEITKLIKQLGNGDWKVRDEATKALVKLGDPARDFLKKALKYKDPEIRIRGAHILNKRTGHRIDLSNLKEIRIRLISDESDPGKTRIEIRTGTQRIAIPDWDTLSQKLERMFDECKSKKIDIPFIIDPDVEIPLQDVVNALNACRKARIEDVRFSAKPSEPEEEK